MPHKEQRQESVMKRIVLHPFLFALFPIVFLFSHNINIIPFSEMLLPAAVMLAATSLLLIVLWGIFGHAQRSGVVVFLVLIFFYSYGFCHKFIINAPIQRDLYMGPEFILITWSILLILGAILILCVKRSFKNLTGILNIVSVCLVAMSILQIGVHYLGPGPTLRSANHELGHEGEGTQMMGPRNLRDIYYIVVDGYAGADVLNELYQYDNHEFLSSLSRRGFYVVPDGKSNYCQTALSVASALNCDYIDRLIKSDYVHSADRRPLTAMIQDNYVTKFLRQKGFTTVAFSSGIAWTEMTDADFYLTPTLFLSVFQNLLINMTPLHSISKKLFNKSQFDLHRDRILFIFEKIQDLPSKTSPKFVFAHIIAPHPPFVFNEYGEAIERDTPFSFDDGSHYKIRVDASEEAYIRKYRSQLKYVNELLMSTIDGILADYEIPPIIILQSDHGPGSQLNWQSMNSTNLKERFSILNAYYLPDDGILSVYDEITPVNTFRIVLNHYFGMNLEILKDESFFSIWGLPYRFFNVTSRIMESGP